MRVLVTGGTGLVGSHTTAALVADGHEVRLLVRSPDRIAPALAPLGIEEDVSHALGDIGDPESVRRAIDGCDAVVHAASVYSLDPREADVMTRVNAPGAETVLGEAVRQGPLPVVYISSTVAFLPGDGMMVGPDSPVGRPAAPYARTKAEAEDVARRRQRQGDPVTIVYPGGVYGAPDPHLGEQMQLIRNLLRRRVPILLRGRFHAVDVRDTAATILAVVQGSQPSGRYLVPGHRKTTVALASDLAAVTGRRLPAMSVPAGAVAPIARGADIIQRGVPFRLPFSHEGIYTVGCDVRYDDSGARRDLGITPRPFEETLADSVRWLHREGHLRRREAGVLAVG